MKIDIITDNSLIIPEYIINIKNRSNKTIEFIENFITLKNLEEQKKDAKIIQFKEKKKFKKKPFKKRKFYKKTR